MPSEAALCPGYRQVDSFGEDAEYETNDDGQIEEVVEYVTLDLGAIEPTLVPSSSLYRLIGLDTPTPYLQLSGTILKGQHHNLLGTELLFTESSDEQHERGKRPLVHVANTERRIRFKEVELKPRVAAAAAREGDVPSAGGNAKKLHVEHVVGSASRGRRGRGGKAQVSRSKGATASDKP